MKSGIVGALLAFGMAGYALAQVYKWVDADGRVHYGAQPPSAVKARPLAQRQSHGESARASASSVNTTWRTGRSIAARRCAAAPSRKNV
jgi:hypothetical protein